MLKSTVQQEGESFEHFFTDLQILLNDCGYDAAIYDDVIRDHIVFGIHKQKIREKLINEGSELTLQKCLDIARTYEMSQAQVQVMTGNKTVDVIKRQRRAPTHPMRPGASNYKPGAASYNQGSNFQHGATYHQGATGGHYNQSDKQRKQCQNCGKTHGISMCPAKGKKCLYCSNFNHFAVVCRKKKLDNSRKINEVGLNDNFSDLDLDEQYFVDTIDFDKSKNQAFATINVGPKSTSLKFKIDSGAQVNIIPRSIFRSLGIKHPLCTTHKA